MQDNTQINEKRRKIFKAAGIAGLAGFIGLAIPKAVRGAVYFREDDGSMKNLSNLASTKQANTWTQAQTFQGTVSGVGNKVTFSDTATNINASQSYTLQVNLGKTGYIGGVVFMQPDAGGVDGAKFHTMINFTSSLSDTASYSTGLYDERLTYSKFAGDSYLTHKMFSTTIEDILVEDCYINGQNLDIVFTNLGASTKTLSVYGTAVVFQ